MELSRAAEDLKRKAIDSIEEWGESLIDSYVSGNRKLEPLRIYLKRGLHNGLARGEEKIDKLASDVLLFLGDENGNYDSKQVASDLLKMFEEMDDVDVKVGPVDMTVGKGVIRIHIPRNPLMGMFFGDTSAVKITKSDIEELIEIFIKR